MNVLVDGVRYRLPDFLVVGAARSGTTGLYYDLVEHPDLFLPALQAGFHLLGLWQVLHAQLDVFSQNGQHILVPSLDFQTHGGHAVGGTAGSVGDAGYVCGQESLHPDFDLIRAEFTHL